jgi:hypothetical protein
MRTFDDVIKEIGIWLTRWLEIPIDNPRCPLCQVRKCGHSPTGPFNNRP